MTSNGNDIMIFVLCQSYLFVVQLNKTISTIFMNNENNHFESFECLNEITYEIFFLLSQIGTSTTTKNGNKKKCTYQNEMFPMQRPTTNQ